MAAKRTAFGDVSNVVKNINVHDDLWPLARVTAMMLFKNLPYRRSQQVSSDQLKDLLPSPG